MLLTNAATAHNSYREGTTEYAGAGDHTKEGQNIQEGQAEPTTETETTCPVGRGFESLVSKPVLLK